MYSPFFQLCFDFFVTGANSDVAEFVVDRRAVDDDDCCCMRVDGVEACVPIIESGAVGTTKKDATRAKSMVKT